MIPKVSTNGKLAIGGGILFISALIYAYHQGKKEVTIAPLPNDTPPGGGTPTNTPSNNAMLLGLVEKLFIDIDGVSYTHDNDILKEILELSNTDLVQFYDIWNTKHQQDYGETLIGSLLAEKVLPWSEWDTLRKSILSRMAQLNLK